MQDRSTEHQPPVPAPRASCPGCGAPLAPSARFCPRCGRPRLTAAGVRLPFAGALTILSMGAAGWLATQIARHPYNARLGGLAILVPASGILGLFFARPRLVRRWRGSRSGVTLKGWTATERWNLEMLAAEGFQSAHKWYPRR